MRWLASGEESLPADVRWLSEREAGYLATIRFTKRRTEFLLRRHTGKLAVAAVAGLATDAATLARIEILNRLTGAPYVQVDGERAALDISLTDRAGWAVALVGSEGSMAAGTLGVDLEIVEPRSAGFLSDFLTPAEQEYVGTHADETDRHAAANLIWSAKEAALKVMRVGLRADTRTVEVSLDDRPDPDGWRSLAVPARRRAAVPRLVAPGHRLPADHGHPDPDPASRAARRERGPARSPPRAQLGRQPGGRGVGQRVNLAMPRSRASTT